ncbi:lactonase family protein [Streptomyces sp. NBC_01808]|uniref:lactonase family protein n=1 Tax=Streptomyces sp. NBC_01808 TaxID=2975947 RepID=UPI002DD93FFF|nr:lactonase family protein [Streptomyces sp. NBC_01808]WSA37668.1 lactonase family protein [Streptomyces sp. NBC_01808]
MPSRPTRRAVLLGAAGIGALGAAGIGTAAIGTAHAGPPQTARPLARRPLYLGTYGQGILACTYDTATGALAAADGGFGDVTNPDFLALSPAGGVLYSTVGGGAEGGVRAYAIGADGALSALGGVQSTGGAGVTHLSVHPGGGHLLSANYSSGSVAAHAIEADGSVGERTGFVQHSGSGPDPDRQEGPHAHQIVTDPAGGFVYAVDLGTDSVYTYALDPGSGALSPVSEAKAVPGAGPRHMVFHPRGAYAYVANELDSTVTAYAHDAATGELTRLASLPTLPDDVDPGGNFPAEITISADGRFVYLSNRGHDSVARLAVEDDGAALRLVDTVPCGGNWPRHITLSPDGGLLYSANERGRTIGVFTVDADTGALTASGEPFATASAGCVLPT